MNKKKLMELKSIIATPGMMKVAKEDIPTKVKVWENHYRQKRKYDVFVRCLILDDILKVAFFVPEHMRMGGRLPFYELFISTLNRRFVTYNRANDKWHNAKLDRLDWPSYGMYCGESWISKKDSALIKKHLGTDNGGVKGLLEYQLSIRAEELKKRHKRETDPWDLDLEQTPDLPKDWDRWVSKVGIPENYIYYQYTRKGADTGYCTYCEKDVPIKHPKHNADGRCPRCRRKITFKATGRAGTVLTDKHLMYLIQRCKDGYIIRMFEAYRKYSKGSHQDPKCYCFELRRVIYDIKSGTERAYYTGLYKQIEYRWIKGWLCGPNWNYWSGSLSGKVYGKTLPSLNKKELRKTGLVELLRSGAIVDPEKYLAILKKVPQLELISKAKLPRLVDDCFYDYSGFRDSLKATTGNSLTKILGINTQELKRLRENDGNRLFMEWLQYERSIGKEIQDCAISWFCSEKLTPEHLNFISNRMSMVQVYNYMRRQMSENRLNSRDMLTTWKDYLSMATRLKIDTNDEIIFRAKKLKQRHDELVIQCGEKDLVIRAGEILEKYPNVEDIMQSIKDKYEYSNDDYSIIAPLQIEEVMVEGRNLRHCVSDSERYWERIENHETYILFLRKTAQPDKSYYTLEVEPDGTVRQKRTMYDRQNADIIDATKFLAQWQKVIARRLSDADKSLAEKSQILREQEFAQLREDQIIIHTGDLAGNLLVDVLKADLMENEESPQLLSVA